MRDLGNPTLSSNRTFTINITDRNDNVPQLVSSVPHISLPENASIGESILLIDVTDLDACINAEIALTLEDTLILGLSDFRIRFPFVSLPTPNNHIQRSWLEVAESLDFERIKSYRLKLTLFNPTPFEGSQLMAQEVSSQMYFT